LTYQRLHFIDNYVVFGRLSKLKQIMEKTPRSHPILEILNLNLLVALSLTYGIGIGMAYHLGAALDWVNLVLGLLASILLLEMRNFLSAYYDHPESPLTTLHQDDPGYETLVDLRRQVLLQTALTVLTAGATVTVILIFRHAISTSATVLLGIAWFICFFTSAPPLRLEKNGYGELVEAILVVTLIPALAFTLQGKMVNYILIMLTLPLTLIYLAMKIAISFESYGFEVTHGNRSLTARMGWQKAMNLHNLLILAAFVLIGVFGLAGLTWSFVWPMLLGLPLGVYQIFLIQQISAGVKPSWRILRFVSGGLFLLMLYLILLTLWT
jgi:1,4-dihydroxy-2-naphthoate octaprenyltransferase